MNAERLHQIEKIYHEALEIPVEQREFFIEESCGEDIDLRREVESLLIFDKTPPKFIDAPPASFIHEVFSEQEKLSNLINQKVGHYSIKKLLGKGGMGEVFLAEDLKLNRKVALKFLPFAFIGNSYRLRRFEQEAFSASALNHPNILTIYEFGTDNEINFLATEYVEGKTLREVINSSELNVKIILQIAEQTAFALSAAHRAGIIHRDIKPENIMLREDGIVKILDFGLAKLIKTDLLEELNQADPESAESKILSLADTNLSSAMGTMAYMSPEQTRRLADIDGATDIWSLGVVIYEMLTGKTPFQQTESLSIIDTILKGDFLPLKTYFPNIPIELERIVEKSLRVNRNERYQNINEVLKDLRNLKDEWDFKSKLDQSQSPQNTNEEINKDTEQKSFYQTNNVDNDKYSIDKVYSTANAEHFIQKNTFYKYRIYAILFGISLLMSGFIFLRYFKNADNSKTLKYLVEPIKQDRITTTGDVQSTAISPNGEFLAYITKEGKNYSLKVKNLTDNKTETIIQPSEKEIFDSTYFPDGNEIFFLQKDDSQSILVDLYKISTKDKIPIEIVADVDSIISFNPKSDEIVFRRNDLEKQESSIIITRTDGSDERQLAVRELAEGFANNPVWLADGKTIATVAKSKIGDIKEFSLFTINVADGKQTPIGSSRWRWTQQLQFNKNDNELILNAQDNPGEFDQFWRVSLPDGKVIKVTNDFNKYEGGILTADGLTLTATVNRKDVEIYVAPLNNIANAKKISAVAGASYYGLDWTPDGKIVFATNAGQHRDIWIVDANGENPKQLTNENFVNYDPVVTRDGRFIVYNSEKTGNANVWRMNLDGTNPVQITNGKTDLNPTVTPDSRWIIYANTQLWKVPIDGGGESTELTSTNSYLPTVSTDGKYIGYRYILPKPPFLQTLSIIPISGGTPIKSLGQSKDVWRWLGDSIVYVDSAAGYSNLFSASIKDSNSKQLTNFKSDKIFSIAFSHDEKQIAFIRGSVINEAVIIKNFR